MINNDVINEEKETVFTPTNMGTNQAARIELSDEEFKNITRQRKDLNRSRPSFVTQMSNYENTQEEEKKN